MADENQTRALSNVDVTYTNPGCTCEDGTVASWITAEFRIVITPDGNTYKLQIYTRLYAQYYMTWTGAGTLKVKVTWKGTDGSTKTYNNSIQTSTPLQGSGQQSSWNGPLTFTGISAVGAKSLNVDIDLDLLRTMCINHKTYSGPDYERSSGSDTHFQHFYLTKDINVEAIPLVTAPTISSLTNTNKFNSQDGESASTNSIGLSWTHSGGSAITESYYKIGDGSWTKTSSTTSHTITGLTAGTSYTIYVYSKNSAGDSNTLSTTIKTKQNPPTIASLTNTNKYNNQNELSASADSIGLSWTHSGGSAISESYYKIGDGSWTKTSSTTSHTITGLTAGTNYTIYVYSKSTYGDSNTLSITVKTRESAPTIVSLTNTNKYNNQSGVSASTNSISLSWTYSSGGAITESYYRIGTTGTWTKTSNTTSHTITGLTEETSYTIYIYSKNSYGDEGNTLSITVRTRGDIPELLLTLSSVDLESLTFAWSSTKTLSSTQYKIDNGSWINLSQTGTSGSFVAKWFDPNTTHTIYFKGISALDGLNAIEVNASGTTLDIAHIDSIGTCIFGANITITISSESSKKINLQIKTTGNGRTPTFNFENIAKGTYIFSPTQAQLDEMYKCFTNTNSIPIYFLLTTVGDNKSWNDTQQEKSLQLTGIAKTAHVGVNNSPKRAQAFIGVNNSPRRAVFWVGDSNNVPRRCI